MSGPIPCSAQKSSTSCVSARLPIKEPETLLRCPATCMLLTGASGSRATHDAAPAIALQHKDVRVDVVRLGDGRQDEVEAGLQRLHRAGHHHLFAPAPLDGGPGQKVGIVGLGSLGHMGLKLAHAMGANVTLFTTSPDKAADTR